MKAVILAAGEGSRLRPLTNRRPKPMLPIGNKPLLESVVEAVSAAGVNEIILVVGYQRERIQNHFGDGDRWNVDITYAVQEKQIGTGHALLQAEPFIESDFITLNGDRHIESRVVEDLIDERRETEQSCLAVTRVETPNRFGVVELDGQIVTDLIEKPNRGATSSRQINAGVYAFGPEIFSAIRDTESYGEQELTTTLQTQSAIRPLRAVQCSGIWGDVSYPWDLLWLNNYILDQQRSTDGSEIPESVYIASNAAVHDDVVLDEDVSIQSGAAVFRGTSLGENVSVGANAVIEDAVVFPDATIRPGAVIRNCVIGANATIGVNTTIEGGSVDVTLDGQVHHDVVFGGLIGDNARLGGNVTINPGTIIGESVTADSGTVVSGQIADNAFIQRG
ncbi:sugar phosphate nucleotidyltransferase [Haladaptatus caseinilyticus]|uniref:sugar phosphate nucleotidyltransferase n=1 Tax=Haladaptatus caseinilyticus TaxID=2993314 RepID=UPI00224AEDE0|nr:sugar phosphate nucleotidyltransferase [Haladaptatus caseinilyticus]